MQGGKEKKMRGEGRLKFMNLLRRECDGEIRWRETNRKNKG